MAGRPPLTHGARGRLLAVVAAVLVGHAVALHWVSQLQLGSTLLQPMAAPMYTRVLVPMAPVAPPPVAVARAPVPAAPRKRLHAAPSTPPTATPTEVAQAEPEPAPETPPAPGPEPAHEPQPAAQAPAAAASADVAAAASAQPAASTPSSGTTTTSASPDATAGGWPPDTRLRYRLGGRFRSGDLYGNARVLWQRDAQRYQVRVEVEVTFWATLVMTSQGQVAGDTLAPAVYEEVRNGKPRGVRIGEREVMLANGTVVGRPQGVQDTASQFVELSHRFASGKDRLEVGRTVSLWMARPGAVDLWTYDITDREVLRTALGDIEAFHLKPRPIANPHGNITAEMWFAPSLQYLPVRIRVSMGQEAVIDLLVEAIDQR